MNGSFLSDYLVLVSFASYGVFQMAAACNGLRGLLLFQGRRWALLFGLGLAVGGTHAVRHGGFVELRAGV